MKNSFISLLFVIGLVSCYDENVIEPSITETNSKLEIIEPIGIKLESSFVTSEVAMNIKMLTGQTVTIKIFDISNKVVSKETMVVGVGDNILKVHTLTLPSSSYRIGVFDSKNKQLGVTDFNKL
jgi:hypothetical protein